MNRILITGAAGKIGSTLREGMRGRYAVLRLSDIAPLDPARAGEEIMRADLTDLAEVEGAMRDVDCVVHLGAIAGEDTWDKILPHNVVGTWNVFEAARRQGVHRVIYASSHHVVGFYRRARFIDQTVAPRPDGVYGVSKVFGEAVGRLFADKHGLSVACLRIGAFRDKPADRRLLPIWLSPRDAVRLVGCCIDAPDYHFIVVYGVSNNRRNRYRNAGIESLGYRPQDDSEDYAADILSTPDLEDAISRQFHGGLYAQMGFDGDLARIE
ncbi:NAD-dependent epimerase/dehydratase family protein [Rhizobium sullae]|uniref:Uronate dehydrogenase n=1 Tax=Rhizobium sullae TaxID=50338 RepID=A0A4R3PVA7_RHISU|nr:NAD(P)-dependent oxidoreductase [Rhizobium sullae]TCU11780.1 uronate dehydrogenase [Rhizobium sullae]